MGKLSKDILSEDLEQHKAGDNFLSKKRKKKRSHDVNPENLTSGEGNCKNNICLEGLEDTVSHKKKKKNTKEQEEFAASEQEVFVKPKKQKMKAVQQAESKEFSLENASTNKKKKDKKLVISGESGYDTPLHSVETENCEHNKIKPPDYQNSENINSEGKKRKKKIALETVEESTEDKSECPDAGDISHTKKKKKKHQSLGTSQKVQGNCISNMNEIIETTNKDRKKKNKQEEIVTEFNAESPAKKIKPVMAKFNAEEAAVTEEEINQFCDEIDEEDNKQYEDWVQLIESMLGPKKRDAVES